MFNILPWNSTLTYCKPNFAFLVINHYRNHHPVSHCLDTDSQSLQLTSSVPLELVIQMQFALQVTWTELVIEERRNVRCTLNGKSKYDIENLSYFRWQIRRLCNLIDNFTKNATLTMRQKQITVQSYIYLLWMSLWIQCHSLLSAHRIATSVSPNQLGPAQVICLPVPIGVWGGWWERLISI